MAGFAMLGFVVEKLVGLLPLLQTKAARRRDLQDNALRSGSHALTETSLYHRDIGRGRGRNADVEAQSSRYWSAAAIPIRHFDNELAQLCEYKSEYWINPELWTQKEAEQFGVGLDDVTTKYRQLLSPRIKRIRSKTPETDQVLSAKLFY